MSFTRVALGRVVALLSSMFFDLATTFAIRVFEGFRISRGFTGTGVKAFSFSLVLFRFLLGGEINVSLLKVTVLSLRSMLEAFQPELVHAGLFFQYSPLLIALSGRLSLMMPSILEKDSVTEVVYRPLYIKYFFKGANFELYIRGATILLAQFKHIRSLSSLHRFLVMQLRQ